MCYTAIRKYYKRGDNVDTSTIVQLISSLGFPIACCIAMFWQNNKLTESHKEEVSKLNEAINNNTIALNHIIDKLGGDNSDS